ncbi:hypothetical protein SAMN04488029_2701 [Reichenbachiella faecimaris]|uniref:Uncharacterized protein n=1 Tax=Reichenbachiella faecimaris TaxID=692418 RepID=A0A1W2GHE3_REIFA|nr:MULTISPECIES: hypothetical protein [Reichenbachiella]MDW3208925.1 hypothetical protein [Reichenbachiella sp.]SMD36079.1 hypothetical protein SAMN04488029_2701 [Reichenbachiella faecimaris]
MNDKKENKSVEQTASNGMVDLLLNILENSKSSKEDKALSRAELKRMIATAA